MSSNLDRGSKIRIAIAIVLALAFMVVLIFNIQLRMMPEWENTSLHYELGEKVDIKATDVLSRNSHSFTVDTSKINENEPGLFGAMGMGVVQMVNIIFRAKNLTIRLVEL